MDRSTLYEWGTCLILSAASLEVHSSCYVPIPFDHVTLSDQLMLLYHVLHEELVEVSIKLHLAIQLFEYFDVFLF